MKATARPSPSAITQAFVPKPPRERPSASRMSRSACVPFSTSSRGLLMRTNAGAIQERHPELPPGLLRKPQQALPDTQARPADEGLSRPRPETEVRGDGAPFGSILVTPEDGRDRAAQIPRRGLAPRAARFNQRLQLSPLPVVQHR